MQPYKRHNKRRTRSSSVPLIPPPERAQQAARRPRRQQQAITDTDLNSASEGTSSGYHVIHHGNTQQRNQPLRSRCRRCWPCSSRGGSVNYLADQNGRGSRSYCGGCDIIIARVRYIGWCYVGWVDADRNNGWTSGGVMTITPSFLNYYHSKNFRELKYLKFD